MHLHFIAIGGSAMHNLAIALHKKGFTITGSDDEVFEPSRTRLAQFGLLPQTEGWNPDRILDNLDAVILGMHARADNPELLRAKEVGLKIYSYPEYLYKQTKEKTRVVIGGSHGKTTTTSMVMHVLKQSGISFDYMVGSNIEGFDTMVGLSHETKIAVFEGDEYLSSPIDPRPKFHHYHPHIALLTGIAWDHINVFPTWEMYVEQFDLFARSVEPGGTLIYFDGDRELRKIVEGLQTGIETIPYSTPGFVIKNNRTFLLDGNRKIQLEVFGEHNLQNIAGAKQICNLLGIDNDSFYSSISTFKGSGRRLEVIARNEATTVFFDFAHSPSKLKATTTAVRAQFPDRKLVAVMELHTFSSLKKEFLPLYRDTMLAAHQAFVFFDQHTLEHKRLEPITREMVKEAFGGDNVRVFTSSSLLFELLEEIDWAGKNLLIMTSGNFSGINIREFGKKITEESLTK